MEDSGILKSSIDLFYHCDYLLLQRKEVYMKFLTKIMTNVESASEVTNVLYCLASEYKKLYDTFVSSVTGSIEKRQQAGKIMIESFESNRNTVKDEYRLKFASVKCVTIHLVDDLNESFGSAANEESNLVFGFLDKYIYESFWKWLHVEKGIHVSNYIKERTSDVDYPYSDMISQDISTELDFTT